MTIDMFFPLISFVLTAVIVLVVVMVAVVILVWAGVAVGLGVVETRRSRRERGIAEDAGSGFPSTLFE